MKPSSSTPKENVFLFVPNIIGYLRVILCAVALYYLSSEPYIAMGFYTVSCLLDAVDGNAARYFDQCSKFGAVLDMVTDRCTTTCLLCYLASAYPAYSLIFQFLISLDISSHYMQMYASLSTGSTSHKAATYNSTILRLYYTNNKVLFGVCAGDQLFFIGLYLLSAGLSQPWIWWATAISAPISVLKQGLNIVQLVGSSNELAKLDIKNREKGKRKA